MLCGAERLPWPGLLAACVASGPHPIHVQHWREAIEKTDMAEHEVATAQLHADKANRALGKAQQAESVMGQHASEHDRVRAYASGCARISAGCTPGVVRWPCSLAPCQGPAAQGESVCHGCTLRSISGGIPHVGHCRWYAALRSQGRQTCLEGQPAAPGSVQSDRAAADCSLPAHSRCPSASCWLPGLC